MSYTIGGDDLAANIVIAAPTGVELSDDNGSSFHAALTLIPNGGAVSTTTIEVRINALAPVGNVNEEITDTCPGATEKDVTVTGTVLTASVPTILVGKRSLNLGSTSAGSPGTASSYTVSGSNLTANIAISAPASVELSDDGGNSFHASLTLTQSGGTVATTTIEARIADSASIGTISGEITATSTGASDQDVTVAGTVTGSPALVVSTGSLTLPNTVAGVAGAVLAYTISGSSLTGTIIITAPTGVELSDDNNASFHSSLVLTSSNGSVSKTAIGVRIMPTAPLGAVDGSITDITTGATERDVAVTGTVATATLQFSLPPPLVARTPVR